MINEFINKGQNFFSVEQMLSRQLRLIIMTQDLLGSKNTAFIDSMDMFTTLGNRTDQTGKRIIIYCDGEAFKRIMSLWFNIIFKKTNTAAAADLLESMVFKHKIFGQARFVSNNGNTDNPYEIDIENFEDAPDFKYVHLKVKKIKN